MSRIEPGNSQLKVYHSTNGSTTAISLTASILSLYSIEFFIEFIWLQSICYLHVPYWGTAFMGMHSQGTEMVIGRETVRPASGRARSDLRGRKL